MIGNDGKPIARAAILAAIGVFNTGARGSAAFGGIPRALVTILTNLKIGKTTYVKGTDGMVPVSRGKDGKIVGR